MAVSDKVGNSKRSAVRRLTDPVSSPPSTRGGGKGVEGSANSVPPALCEEANTRV
jgi:hypothetical protein